MAIDGVLVFDLGTQSLRASVLGPDGQRIYSRAFPVATHRKGLVCEQDPEEWRSYLQAALREIAALPVTLRGVVASGTLGGAVCLSASGSVLRPVLMYADRRPSIYIDQIEDTTAFERVRRVTGWRSYSGDLLPQALYIARKEPEVWAETRYLLDSTGYLNWLLTGQATLDEYSLFGCYALPGTGSVNAELVSELRLDDQKFGRPVRLGEVIGEMSDPARTGLRGLGCPVVSATYDSMTAYIGSGRSEPGEGLDISGTVTSFGVVHGEQVIDRQRRIYSVPLPETGLWLVRGSTAMASGCLEWCREMLGCADYGGLDSLVASSVPGAAGVLFLPFLAGERAPIWNPDAKGAYYGLTPDVRRADLARAVYEGLCFALRHIQSTMAEHRVAIGEVSIAGGLSRNNLLAQIKSSVTGKRLLCLRDSEVTTAGSAAVAGRAVGWYATWRAGFDRMAPAERVVEPVSADAVVYDACFERYRELVDSVVPLFQRRQPATTLAQ